jgi:hypothetical protein
MDEKKDLIRKFISKYANQRPHKAVIEKVSLI